MNRLLKNLDDNAERYLMLACYTFCCAVIIQDVARRYLLNYSAGWSQETAQYAFIYLGWIGGKGSGRALGCGEVRFGGEVTPKIKKVTYKIDMKRVINRRLVMGVGDGVLEADGTPIYTAADLRVGLSQRS